MALAELQRLLREKFDGALVGSVPELFPTEDALNNIVSNADTCKLFNDEYTLLKEVSKTQEGIIYAVKLEPAKQRWKELANIPLVVKKEKIAEENREQLMEVLIGSRLNLLLEAKIAHGFSRTYDWFVCREKNQTHIYTVTERQTESFIESLIDTTTGISKTLDIDYIRAILAQLLVTLSNAQNAIGYVHYDLHSNNVMVRDQPDSDKTAGYWSMELLGQDRVIYVERSDAQYKQVKIIDYGRNRLRSPGFYTGDVELLSYAYAHDAYKDESEDPGIDYRYNPQYDMRRFAMHLVENLTVQNKDYMEELEANNAQDYIDLLQVLDAMCGHKAVRTFKAPGSSDEANQHWDNIQQNFVGNYEEDIDPSESHDVNAVLGEFKEHGVRYIIAETKAQIEGLKKSMTKEEKGDLLPRVATILVLYWGWTPFNWAGPTASEILMTYKFFEPLRQKPPVSETVTILSKFMDPSRLRRMDKAQLSACVICTQLTASVCTVCSTPYCSPDCQVEDWNAGHGALCRPQ